MAKYTYKAFDENFQCRGFQFGVGQEYEVEGKVELCVNGFHACQNPFDVLNYYDLTSSRFALVEQSGETIKGGDKTASRKIKIKEELKLGDWIKAAFEYINFSESDISGSYTQLASSGCDAKLASSGNYAKLASSGNYAKLVVEGDSSVAVCAGVNSRVKGVNGTLICLTYYKEGKPIKFVTGEIGKNGLKENTYYTLDENGEFKNA